MIADFALHCGWFAPGDQKVVWAVMPSSEAQPRPARGHPHHPNQAVDER